MEKVLKALFAITRTDAILQRRLSTQGLSFNDFMLLYYLNEELSGKLRRVDFAAKLGLTASGITRMILPLEKIGVIKREESAEDGRERFTTLTPAGKRLFTDVKNSLEEKLEDMIPSGNVSRFVEMAKLLEIFAE